MELRNENHGVFSEKRGGYWLKLYEFLCESYSVLERNCGIFKAKMIAFWAVFNGGGSYVFDYQGVV